MLAFSPATAWVMYPAWIVCVFLLLHALRDLVYARSGMNPKKQTIELPWWSRAALFLLETLGVAVWLWLFGALAGWMFVYGDSEGPVQRAWPYVAAVVALVFGIIASKGLLRDATRRYVQIHFSASAFLIASFGFFYLYESVHSIEGLTANSTAQRVFVRMAGRIDGPTTVREGSPPPNDPTFDSQRKYYGDAKTYWIHDSVERRGRFVIVPHRWFGWFVVESQFFPPSARELARAKEVLHSNPKRAELILQMVIENYPNAPAEAEAKELLAEIELRQMQPNSP